MPVYIYNCPACELEVEEKRGIAQADDPLSCPICGGDCQRVFALSFNIVGRTPAPVESAPNPTMKLPGRRHQHRPGCPCC